MYIGLLLWWYVGHCNFGRNDWFPSLIGRKDETSESSLLQTESNQILDLNLNIYNSKTT
jgi:hypothetical protein